MHSTSTIRYGTFAPKTKGGDVGVELSFWNMNGRAKSTSHYSFWNRCSKWKTPKRNSTIPLLNFPSKSKLGSPPGPPQKKIETVRTNEWAWLVGVSVGGGEPVAGGWEHYFIPTYINNNNKYVQQLLLFLNKVTSYIDSNSRCDTIYLDFSKAFDSVPHNELLVKLWRIGVTNNVWYWLREYLYDRRQCVSINGRYSSLLYLSSQVYPKAAYLVHSSLCSTLMTFNRMYSCVFLFADDTKCLQPIQSIPADMHHLQEA